MSSTPTYTRPVDDRLSPQQTGANQNSDDDDDDEAGEVAHRFLFFNVMPSWMVSFVCHVALIVVLALFWLPRVQKPKVALEAGGADNSVLDQMDVNFDEIELDADALETEDSAAMSEPEPQETEPESLLDVPTADFGTLMSAEESNFDSESFSTSMESFTGNETSGRTEEGRKALLRKNGGNAASEKAVELALEWIARHQLPDGGWSIDHTIGPGKNRDQNDPGDNDSARAGATALALLPFLGHGDTHRDGKYKKTVKAGLEYLKKRARANGRGISWHEPGGTMYSHGLVSIVFGEAYAMTGDRELAPFAQGSIWFIEQAQDPLGGGWRYGVRTPGDTSAVGWQLMALKSANMSGLDYKKQTIKLAEKFLDSVSIDNGAWYGYMTRPNRNSGGEYNAGSKGTSSVGLLCRMYMGWDRSNDGLSKGVERIDQIGPSIGNTSNPNSVDMYYNYYATQLMKHWGGSEWRKWNDVMRDFLIEQQAKDGTQKGSWYWNSKTHKAKAGGRLYHTALATMTLEVYYRYLPIYDSKAAEDEFPLD